MSIEVKDGFVKFIVRSYSEDDIRKFYKEEFNIMDPDKDEELMPEIIPLRSRVHIEVPYYMPIRRLADVVGVYPLTEFIGDELAQINACAIEIEGPRSYKVVEVEHSIKDVMKVITEWCI